MDNKYKVGDVVVLKIGGPKMVVDHFVKIVGDYGPGYRAVCKWYDKNDQPCSDSYSEILSVKYDDLVKSILLITLWNKI